MTELRTLKDLRLTTSDCLRLRKEAKKWIEHYRTDEFWSREDSEGNVIAFIKYFSNITEEEIE